MSWILAMLPVLGVGLAVLGVLMRRAELRAYARNHTARAEAKERGSHKARLQHPDVDLAKCIGCGACVNACPEEGVLSLLHGQAVVVHGARCVGHGLCATACPTGAIALTLGDLSDRRDLPALDEELEAVGVPGLFVAGELGGFALVRTAVAQGTAAAEAVARRLESAVPARRERALVGAGVGGLDAGRSRGALADDEAAILDLLIVGAGPGGLACSLRAKELGVRFATIEQEDRLGGTVAAYPRRKLVMTQPMELPLHGRLQRLSYQKEELVELWESVASQHALPIRTGVGLQDLATDDDGTFVARTTAGVLRAHNVCLALGRRGTPRKLGVPGEELPKVAYSLLDAESYRGRRVLVVGGGDSAIEAALGLAAQPGNEVTLSYRKKALFRLKARNEARADQALREGVLTALFESEVLSIEADRVRLRVGADGVEQEIGNDEVFVFAGGVPPFGLLENAGVSFDPNDRPPPSAAVDQGTGLLAALVSVLVAASSVVGWALWHRSYYGLDVAVRSGSLLHDWLRPAGPVGLSFGVLAVGLFVWNLAYLVRRSPRWGSRLPGSLKLWMSSHVFTGLFAFLCVLVHAGFAVKHSVGGHAFAAFAIVVVAGVVGRYLYAFVPRATNGAEVDLEEVRGHLSGLSGEWDRDGRGFGGKVRAHVDEIVNAGRWRPSLARRILAIAVGQWRLRRALHALRAEGMSEGIPDQEVYRLLALARRAYRLTLQVTHYEEIRAVLSSWRYVHRWLALLMVLLTVIHIVTALRFGAVDWGALPLGGGDGR